MERSTAIIEKAIQIDIAADATLSPNLTSTLASSVWKKLVSFFAVCVNAFETVKETYLTANEEIINGCVVGSAEWFRRRALEFQQGDDLLFDGDKFIAYYNTVDASKQTITFCTAFNRYRLNALFPGNGITLSVATGETPTALSAGEILEFTNYIASITPTGTLVTINTGTADFLGISCEIRYDSRYGASIEATVLAAIKAYIQDLPDDELVVDSLFKMIEDIEGVKYIVATKVTVRDAVATVPIILYSMIDSAAVPYSAVQTWQTKFGYMIEETATNQTWADTIKFTPETI